MPASLESMAYFGSVPWHGLGTQVPESDVFNIEKCIEHAGLAWDVISEPIFLQDGTKLEDGKAMTRTYNGRRQVLGIVGPRFVPLQNREAFDFFKPFLDERQAAIHTAGSLDKGRSVWVLCNLQMDAAEIVDGDKVEKFVLLSNSHDGSRAVRVGFTPIRVVCANTLAMAHSDSASKLIRVRHTRKMHTSLNDIRETMNLINQEFEASVEQYRRMAHKTINGDDLERYVKKVFKMDEDSEGDELPKKTRNIIDAVRFKYYTGKGTNIPGVAGTVWGAYNALTEYLAWERGQGTDTRMQSLWFGDSAKLNERAREIAYDLAT